MSESLVRFPSGSALVWSESWPCSLSHLAEARRELRVDEEPHAEARGMTRPPEAERAATSSAARMSSFVRSS